MEKKSTYAQSDSFENIFDTKNNQILEMYLTPRLG